jgi:hypothetical protein
MGRFIAIEEDGGNIEVHAAGQGLGCGYATFCGLDGADDEIGQRPAKLPRNPKISCEQCRAMIVEARRWTKRDFEAKS